MGDNFFNERRLWFDYLAKLNDRELQARQASGASTWVLLGVAAAIVYRAMPHVPSFVTVPHQLWRAIMFAIIELDVVATCSNLFVLSITPFQSEGRMLPSRARRSLAPLWHISIVASALGGIIHCLLAISATLTISVRVLLVVIGLVLLASAVAMFTERPSITRKKGSKPKFPLLHTGEVPVRLVVPCIVSSVVQLGLFFSVFVLFLLQVVRQQVDWITPLSAATQAVVVLAIVAILMLRTYRDASRDGFKRLERDILIDNLMPEDIRDRFVSELIGPSLAQWLDQQKQVLKTCETDVANHLAMLKQELRGIDSVDPSYPIERSGRAQRLLDLSAEFVQTLDSKVSDVSTNLPGPNDTNIPESQKQVLAVVLNSYATQLDSLRTALVQLVHALVALESHAGLAEPSKATRLLGPICDRERRGMQSAALPQSGKTAGGPRPPDFGERGAGVARGSS